jgi:ABC-type amino acid transport substrate-binding protein
MFYKKILLIFLLPFFFTLSYAKSIVLGTTEWPPYVQDNPEHKGYAYEIVLAAFKAAGYNDVKIIFMPWDDAIKAVNEGELDGIFPEYFSEKRNKDIVYTHSFSDSPLGFYKRINSGIEYPNVHPDKNLMQTLNAMKNYRFGVVKGYINISAFDKNHHLTKVYADSDAENIEQLYNEQVDLALIDQYTAEYLLYHKLPSNYKDRLVFMNPPLGYKKLYVGISRKIEASAKIVHDFNMGLDVIKKNGLIEKIIDRDAEISDDYEHVG